MGKLKSLGTVMALSLGLATTQTKADEWKNPGIITSSVGWLSIGYNPAIAGGLTVLGLLVDIAYYGGDAVEIGTTRAAPGATTLGTRNLGNGTSATGSSSSSGDKKQLSDEERAALRERILVNKPDAYAALSGSEPSQSLTELTTDLRFTAQRMDFPLNASNTELVQAIYLFE